jgi:molybdopterin-guanine dinucleotide biosynthesis protein A
MTTSPAGGSDAPSSTVPVYILAGGQSRRFGSDKARALHRGVPLLVGVARALESVASRTTVVAAREGAYEDLGLKTIGDVVRQKGPLGGLLTAIEDCRGEPWLFLSACDWVGVQAAWVAELLRRRTADSRAVVYKGERYEPLFALYHTSLRDTVADLIEADRLETRNVFELTVTVTLPLPDDWGEAVNLNRPSGEP